MTLFYVALLCYCCILGTYSIVAVCLSIRLISFSCISWPVFFFL